MMYVLQRLSNDEYDQYEVVGIFTTEELATAYGDRFRPVAYPYDRASDWFVAPYAVDPDVEADIAALPPKSAASSPQFVLDPALTAFTVGYLPEQRYIAKWAFGETE